MSLRYSGIAPKLDARTIAVISHYTLDADSTTDLISQLDDKNVVSAEMRDDAAPFSVYADHTKMGRSALLAFTVVINDGLRRRQQRPHGALAARVAALAKHMETELRWPASYGSIDLCFVSESYLRRFHPD